MPTIFYESLYDIQWTNEQAPALPNASFTHVWKIHIPSFQPYIGQLVGYLSNSEISRAGSYNNIKDRERFIISRSGTKKIISTYINIPPEQINIIEGDNKKPSIKTHSSITIQYNIAHSGNIILIAVSSHPVGIDVELVNPTFPYNELLSACFSEQEIAFLESQENPLHAFYLLWTRKEAFIKATAKGIDEEIMFIPCLDGQHEIDNLTSLKKNWRVNSFNITSQYLCSVALEDTINAIKFFDGSATV